MFTDNNNLFPVDKKRVMMWVMRDPDSDLCERHNYDACSLVIEGYLPINADCLDELVFDDGYICVSGEPVIRIFDKTEFTDFSKKRENNIFFRGNFKDDNIIKKRIEESAIGMVILNCEIAFYKRFYKGLGIEITINL